MTAPTGRRAERRGLDHLLSLARAGRTREAQFGDCKRDGECRLALPQKRAHVGSVFPGSLGFGQ